MSPPALPVAPAVHCLQNFQLLEERNKMEEEIGKYIVSPDCTSRESLLIICMRSSRLMSSIRGEYFAINKLCCSILYIVKLQVNSLVWSTLNNSSNQSKPHQFFTILKTIPNELETIAIFLFRSNLNSNIDKYSSLPPTHHSQGHESRVCRWQRNIYP